MSYLQATCPFCGSKAKRFILPNGIITEYYICTTCFKSFTLSQSMIGEIARNINSKAEIITSYKYLRLEKETKLKERL